MSVKSESQSPSPASPAPPTPSLFPESPESAVPDTTIAGEAHTDAPYPSSPNGTDRSDSSEYDSILSGTTAVEINQLLYGGPPGTQRASTSSSKQYYCIIKGTEVGIFSRWTAASPHVTGISGNSHCAFKSFQEACDSFDKAWLAGNVVRLPYPQSRSPPYEPSLPAVHDRM
ncbi:hypothetical protein SISNIDRAFT_470764 [Sistotremastrum niveocremeum HHB9708]|uniref:Ribonuclease H1 N-terminal domain-containing protein n=1 Tax=Sistotremastrum niveocremeum HHB9708 TaxID=1314777 RepID=A0A164NDT6_9AGAM|nr:hypothetical protein SISNIDRAFT_470764 [Sistotremastrum niveocremeum HHB9708]